jgi:hypothetical protein
MPDWPKLDPMALHGIAGEDEGDPPGMWGDLRR